MHSQVTVLSCEQQVHAIYKNVKLDMRPNQGQVLLAKTRFWPVFFYCVVCCIVASSSITGSESQRKRAFGKGDKKEGSGIVPGLATSASEELCANPVITKLQR
jgi:hypothetical protein